MSISCFVCHLAWKISKVFHETKNRLLMKSDLLNSFNWETFDLLKGIHPEEQTDGWTEWQVTSCPAHRVNKGGWMKLVLLNSFHWETIGLFKGIHPEEQTDGWTEWQVTSCAAHHCVKKGVDERNWIFLPYVVTAQHKPKPQQKAWMRHSNHQNHLPQSQT